MIFICTCSKQPRIQDCREARRVFPLARSKGFVQAKKENRQRQRLHGQENTLDGRLHHAQPPRILFWQRKDSYQAMQ